MCGCYKEGKDGVSLRGSEYFTRVIGFEHVCTQRGGCQKSEEGRQREERGNWNNKKKITKIG